MARDEKKWSVLEILNATIPYFEKKSIQNPRLNAERLLAYILKIDRIGIYLQFERVLSNEEVTNFRDLVRRRAIGEPLQYILGETEFMGLPFIVEPGVLIPRPETEVLVNEVLGLQSEFSKSTTTIWDVGTGSGCVAISLAYYWNNCRIIASDISDEAMAVCSKNCELNNVQEKIKLVKHNILEETTLNNEQVDIIVSNPPYISLNELDSLDSEITEHEPHLALTDFKDGLLFYEKLFDLDFDSLGCRFMLIELSGTQTSEILKLLHLSKIKEYSTVNDLNQIPRVLKLKTG